MKFQNTTEDQMASSFCFFKIKPVSLIASVFVLFLVFYASFFGLGFSSILFTSLVLIVSTLLLTFTKQKPVTDQETLNSDHETSLIQQPESETVVKHSNIKSSSHDFLSESESLNHLSSSEESEVGWPFREIVYQSLDCSDGSISDEESDLIEISLPSGHSVGNYEDQEVAKFHGLMEPLAAEINDMNEEDNLIEIDISVGSIKCSRFEIEA